MIAVRLTPDVKCSRSRHPTILRAAASPGPRRSSPACLHQLALSRSGKIYRWEFEKKRKKLEMAVAGPLIANHQDIVSEAALQGLGILYATTTTASTRRSRADTQARPR